MESDLATHQKIIFMGGKVINIFTQIDIALQQNLSQHKQLSDTKEITFCCTNQCFSVYMVLNDCLENESLYG